AETNQVQRCQCLFTTFNNYGFSAADLLSGQTFSITRQDLASVTSAANHNTAASGDCVTVTSVRRHTCFTRSGLQSEPTYRAPYKYSCRVKYFLFLIKLTSFWMHA